MSKHTHTHSDRGSQAGTMHAGRRPNTHPYTHTQGAAGVGVLSHQRWRLRPDSSKSRGQPLDRFPISNQRLKQDRVTDNPPSSSSPSVVHSLFLLISSPYSSLHLHFPLAIGCLHLLHSVSPLFLCQACILFFPILNPPSFISFNAICHPVLLFLLQSEPLPFPSFSTMHAFSLSLSVFYCKSSCCWVTSLS